MDDRDRRSLRASSARHLTRGAARPRPRTSLALVRARAPRPDESPLGPVRRPARPRRRSRRADVVVNLAGTPTVGNPHSTKWAGGTAREPGDHDPRCSPRRSPAATVEAGVPRRQRHRLVRRPRRRGRRPRQSDSRGDALHDRASPGTGRPPPTRPSTAGARVCVLRTAPVMDRHQRAARSSCGCCSRLGLGARLGDGRQYFPMISLRDWVGGVALPRRARRPSSGPFNLCCPQTPDQRASSPTRWRRRVDRPALAGRAGVRARAGGRPAGAASCSARSTLRPRRCSRRRLRVPGRGRPRRARGRRSR